MNKVTQQAETDRFPIRILAEKTSVGTSTLRAWERRYGLLHPERTPKGHRLYREADTQRVLKIVDLLNDGHSLPAIAEILSAEKTPAGNHTTDNSNVAESVLTTPSIWARFIHRTLEATSDFSIERIDAIYNEASSIYPIDMITDRLVVPVITQLGSAWKERPESGIAEEHFYTSWLKNRLGARFHHAWSQARGARIVCACMPGNYHEIGLMLFALSAMARGYRVLYFGADLPLNQLAYIVQRSAAKAVVLGATNLSCQVPVSRTSVATPVHNQVMTELTRIMPQINARVFMGGGSKADENTSINTTVFESAGGILLGENISVALRVFESHVPAYSTKQTPVKQTLNVDSPSS